MTITTVGALKLILIPICFLIYSLLYYLISKTKKFCNLKEAYKPIINFFVFIVPAIIIPFLGIIPFLDPEADKSACLSLLLLPSLVCGIFFDLKSAIGVSLVTILTRSLVNLQFNNDSFKLSDCLAVVFTIFILILIYSKTFKKMRNNYIFSFLMGIFAESIHVLLMYLTNINGIYDTYELIQLYDVYLLVITPLTISLFSIFSHLIDKANPFAFHFDNHIKSKASKRIYLSMVITYVCSFAVTYFITYQQSYCNFISSIISNVDAMVYDFDEAEFNIAEAAGVVQVSRVADEGFFVLANPDEVVVSLPLDYEEFLGERIPPAPGEKGFTEYKEGEVFDFTIANPHDTTKIYSCLAYYKTVYLEQAVPPSGNGENAEPVKSEYKLLALIYKNYISINAGINVRIVGDQILIILISFYLLIFFFIDHKIINNIEKINYDLSEVINENNLTKEIKAENTEEFNNLCSMINGALKTINHYSEELENKILTEKYVSKNIQIRSLTTNFPNSKFFDLYANIYYSDEVSGDFYDYLMINEDNIYMVIADIPLTGIMGAIFMMSLKALIKSYAGLGLSVDQIANNVNREIISFNEKGYYLNCFLMNFNIKTCEFTYVNAGSNNPIIKLNDKFEEYYTEKDLPLGTYLNHNYVARNVILAPNTELVFFTKGLYKMGMTKGLSPEGFIKVLNEETYFNSKQLVNNLLDNLNTLFKNEKPKQDITLMALKFIAPLNQYEHKLTLKAIPNNVPIAAKFVESIMEQYHCPRKAISIILIALDELFSNIAYYAYKEMNIEGEATILLKFDKKDFYMTLIDSGTPFNPLNKEDPDYISKDASERFNKGGLGIFMVRNSVDDIIYKYENKQNILTIKKIIPEMYVSEFKDSYSTTRD